MKTVSKLQKKNETGSAVSIFLQEKERLILECIYNYLVSKEILSKSIRRVIKSN